MSGFRTGEFTRERLGGNLRRFSPLIAARRIEEIDLAALWEAGKRLILLDVDNTLLPWRGHEVPEGTLRWLERGKELGFTFCVISNTRNRDRLMRLCEEMGVDYLLGKFKPSTAMFKAALERYEVEPERAIMVGDQLLTDVLGANRTGIDAIWVEKMPGKEFIGTALISRRVEKVLVRFLYRALGNAPAAQPGLVQRLFAKKSTRQFGKFVVVGGSSFIIDYCIRMTLMFAIPYGDGRLSTAVGEWILTNLVWTQRFFADAEEAAVAPAAAIAASIAILNSFYWNRRWTWRIVGKEERTQQFRRFVLLSGTGLLLNTAISTGVFQILPFDGKPALRIATVIAAGTVAFWNFFGQRFYAFRGRTH